MPRARKSIRKGSVPTLPPAPSELKVYAATRAHVPDKPVPGRSGLAPVRGCATACGHCWKKVRQPPHCASRHSC